MNQNASSRARASIFTNHVVRTAIVLSVALFAASLASAQYGGGGGGTGGTGSGGGTYGSGGYGSSAGKAAGIGAGVAAGAGLLMYAAFHHPGMTGCVQPGDDGLRIVDEKKNVSYALQSGDVLLKPGQRVQLQGKKSKTAAGVQTFAAKKLVKDLGSCGSGTSTAQTQPSAQ